MITFEGDPRKYKRFRYENRYYVQCCESKEIDGKILFCDFKKREDKFKASLKKGITHNCNFTIDNSNKQHSILQYYQPKTNEEKARETFDEEGVKKQLVYLIGRKNISVDAAASEEFYNFICYCIAYGMSLKSGPGENNFLVESQKAYHHFKSSTLSETLLQIGKDVDVAMIDEFKKLTYVSVSIDEGKTADNRNLDFVLENPTSNLSPFPIYTERMEGEKTKDYVTHLLNGLAAINRYGIQIASVIADGNKAQKKAFSFKYKGSLRKLELYPWLKKIIYIPCLCHRTNNAYKNVIVHNESLVDYANSIRDLAETLKEHRKELGKTCPGFVSTRWIYDYDIADFILKYKGEIEKYVTIPEGLDQFFQILKIFKILIRIFESPNTYFFKAFYHLERGLNTFNELMEAKIPCADLFKESLFNYTLNSDEGGIWILGYLFTVQGHDDFYNRIMKNDFSSPFGCLIDSDPSIDEPIDPIETQLRRFVENDYIQNEEEEKNDEEEESDEEEEDKEVTTKTMETQTEAFQSSHPYLSKAKKCLKELLEQEGFLKKTNENLLKQFNLYLDEEKPFADCILDNQLGYSWKQIRASYPAFAPICIIAEKLTSSGVSEASCERTISSQRFIHSIRRRNANFETLDARLSIMNGSLKPRL